MSNLISFWDKKIRPKSSFFIKQPQLLSIIDELDFQIEQFENKINELKIEPKVSKGNLFKPPTNIFQVKQPEPEPIEAPSSPSRYSYRNSLFFSSFASNKEDDDFLLTNNTKNNSLFSSSFNNPIEIEQENIIYKDENKKYIKYTDIDLLIKKIANNEIEFESEDRYKHFIEGFCIQYSLFISQSNLISKLNTGFNYFYSRYRNGETTESNGEEKKQVLPVNLIHFISSFIKTSFKYELDPLSKDNIKKLSDFYKTLMSVYEIKNLMENELKEILTLLEQTQSNSNSIQKEEIKHSISIGRGERFDIFDEEEEAIAKELTRITAILFNKITYKEFFKARFTKKEKKKTSPNIIEAFERFNNLSFFIIEEILSYNTKENRAKSIEKFISIANILKKLNNFNDCMSIVAALNHRIIKGLKKTWKCLSSSTISQFNLIKQFISFEDNYKLLRTQQEDSIKTKQPFLPFLGYYTKKICFLEEQGGYIKNGSLLNCDKIAEFHIYLEEFFKFKNVSYAIERQNDLSVLQCLSPAREEELDKIALQIEPSFTLNVKGAEEEKRFTSTDKEYKRITNGFSDKKSFI